MFPFFRNSYPQIDYIELINKLEENNEDDVKALLFKGQGIKYLPITFEMLAKMKKPLTSAQGLNIYETHQNGKYELAIFEVPWNNSGAPFLPLILDRQVGKIVGIMLPFNELLTVLTRQEQKEIGNLSMIWTEFIIQKSLGINL